MKKKKQNLEIDSNGNLRKKGFLSGIYNFGYYYKSYIIVFAVILAFILVLYFSLQSAQADMYLYTVETLSHDAGLDRRYLSRIFKERYGVALKEYLIGVRMRRAGELLLKGYSVSESAYMVGYADAFNFSKMFRKTVGCSPSEYRKKRKTR